ncbi:hypothetical protein KVH22_25675 [Streptomyces olivaceus]|nr:hypothetical protein [Streptomyces olivaceus]MBZ6258910.1 hypothetical protein [Streptomyces olivaceus]
MLTLVKEDWSGWAAECLMCSSVKLDERDYQALLQDTVSTVAITAKGQEV